jgi:hypothetical protein
MKFGKNIVENFLCSIFVGKNELPLDNSIIKRVDDSSDEILDIINVDISVIIRRQIKRNHYESRSKFA